ncbi:BZ3500_MvSof-1268-A1-R1_Chr2-1g04187 [Microbotryum saponariae]|uniref:BZ3500_MvSof-1268-A1-R1_Chr2-1g04187 protein n=1 Tax=Microbotryum saponariae TaxID=289078 RepID=A0A2X0K7H7_9BASI|nr:BZ3500_MvSof-1268-A1-R1_Chr2-1g04187 [Microbotryum saponariae]SCZ91174.1 BZ3501_MvSof-1269-A2-R1_Chr2-1g03843 [Microbotryum saponariae]
MKDIEAPPSPSKLESSASSLRGSGHDLATGTHPASPVASLHKGDDDDDDGDDQQQPPSTLGKLWRRINDDLSIESHGIAPLTEEQRVDSNFLDSFTMWLTMNATIACFSTGTLGPLLFGFSMKNSFLVIVFFNIFSCAVPSYFAVFGPRLGMRQMAVARYSYGWLGATVPAAFNLISFIGFNALNALLGGQVLASVNPGTVSTRVGIIIIAAISLVLSFCGYRVLHVFERWVWAPVLLAFILLAGFGGRHLGAATSYLDDVPATAGTILSFSSIIVGFSLSWCGCAADFNTYQRSTVSSTKVFVYTFVGLYLPCALLQMMGAAFSAAALSGLITTWEDAFITGSTGGLVAVALEPLRGFGKVLLVFFALGMITNIAPTCYAFSLSMQIVFPFLSKFPRFLFPIVATAIYLPIAIVAADHFAAALSNFLGLLGYWAAIFATIFVIEHWYFRKGRFTSYDISVWDSRSLLPPGIAAIVSSLVGAALVVVSMDQVWWRGPIAVKIAGNAASGGDVGLWLGALAAAIVYVPLRTLERSHFKR